MLEPGEDVGGNSFQEKRNEIAKSWSTFFSNFSSAFVTTEFKFG